MLGRIGLLDVRSHRAPRCLVVHNLVLRLGGYGFDDGNSGIELDARQHAFNRASIVILGVQQQKRPLLELRCPGNRGLTQIVLRQLHSVYFNGLVQFSAALFVDHSKPVVNLRRVPKNQAVEQADGNRRAHQRIVPTGRQLVNVHAARVLACRWRIGIYALWLMTRLLDPLGVERSMAPSQSVDDHFKMPLELVRFLIGQRRAGLIPGMVFQNSFDRPADVLHAIDSDPATMLR